MASTGHSNRNLFVASSLPTWYASIKTSKLLSFSGRPIGKTTMIPLLLNNPADGEFVAHNSDARDRPAWAYKPHGGSARAKPFRPCRPDNSIHSHILVHPVRVNKVVWSPCVGTASDFRSDKPGLFPKKMMNKLWSTAATLGKRHINSGVARSLMYRFMAALGTLKLTRHVRIAGWRR